MITDDDGLVGDRAIDDPNRVPLRGDGVVLLIDEVERDIGS